VQIVRITRKKNKIQSSLNDAAGGTYSYHRVLND